MPPKKAKTTSSGKKRKPDTENAGTPSHMWLLTLSLEYSGQPTAYQQRLFTSNEKAIAAAPALLDLHCPHSTDWRNGLDGFGREEEDDYLGYEYLGSNGKNGVIISNRNSIESSDDDLVEVKAEKLQVDPIIDPTE